MDKIKELRKEIEGLRRLREEEVSDYYLGRFNPKSEVHKLLSEIENKIRKLENKKIVKRRKPARRWRW